MSSQLARALRRSGLGFMLAVAPLPVAAQPSVSSSDSARARAFSQLPPGVWVRLGAGDAMLSGIVVAQDRQTVRIRTTDGSQHALEAPAIHTIWIQRGRATSAGARNGALTGAVIGVVTGVLAGGFMCESGCGGRQVRGGAVGLAVGAGIGTLVGGAIGSVVPSWERLLP